MVGRQTHVPAGSSGFTATDERLEVEYLSRVLITHFLSQHPAAVLLACLEFALLVKAAQEIEETHHLIVTHGNAAAGLVRHMDVMSLLNQTREGAAHRDDVVIGVRREDKDVLRVRFGTLRTVRVIGIRFAARPTGDSMLEVVEDLDVTVIGGRETGDEFIQTVVVIVLVGQFENRFAGLLAEPNDGTTDELVFPFATGHHPWRSDTGQSRCRIEVEQHAHILMQLQRRCRTRRVITLLDSLTDNRRLVLAPRHQHDFLRTANGIDTHGNGAHRHLFRRTEHDLGILLGVVIQQHETGQRVERRAGFVKSDVTATADTQEDEVQSASRSDTLLVLAAERHDVLFAHVPRNRMDILRQDVHMVEQEALHLGMTAKFIIRHRVILVHVEEHHIAETQAFLTMLAHQFREHIPRRAARGDSHHIRLKELLTLTNLLGDIVCHSRGTRPCRLINSHRQLLETRDATLLKHILRTIQPARNST